MCELSPFRHDGLGGDAVFFEQFIIISGFGETILHPDKIHLHRMLSAESLRDRAAETPNDIVFLNSQDTAGP